MENNKSWFLCILMLVVSILSKLMSGFSVGGVFVFFFLFFGGGYIFQQMKKKKQPNKHSRRAVDWFERGQPIKRLESAKTGCIFIT